MGESQAKPSMLSWSRCSSKELPCCQQEKRSAKRKTTRISLSLTRMFNYPLVDLAFAPPEKAFCEAEKINRDPSAVARDDHKKEYEA